MGVHFESTSVPSVPATMAAMPARPRHRRNSLSLSTLYTKYISRQVTLAWKRVTFAARNNRNNRASILPEGFVLISNIHNKRRSIYMS